ncbi:hypothetical protein D918_02460 [Trichuris suis]|nr:hypothetical protein D918_02460 [Trichuris suis]
MKFFLLILFSTVSVVSSQIVSIRQRDLEKVVSELYAIDTKGTDPSKFKFNYASPHQRGNESLRFALYVDPQFLAKPTVATFVSLVKRLIIHAGPHNFTTAAGISMTPAKIREYLQKEAKELSTATTACFLRLLKTEVMEKTRLFLAKNGFDDARSEKVFANWMQRVWLAPVKIGKHGQESIPFTHVFLLEKHYINAVSGLHYWLTYGLLELNNKARFEDYLGEINAPVAVIRYSLGHSTKPRGSFLLGTTPEFDLALYTICLVGRSADGCRFMLKGCIVNLVVHRLKPHNQVTTAYPKEAICEEAKRE